MWNYKLGLKNLKTISSVYKRVNKTLTALSQKSVSHQVQILAAHKNQLHLESQEKLKTMQQTKLLIGETRSLNKILQKMK